MNLLYCLVLGAGFVTALPQISPNALHEPSAFTRRARNCDGFKNVVFNSGFHPNTFSQMSDAAANFITFGLGTSPGQIPMMPFGSMVDEAISLIASSPPEFLLTFNEPDFSYAGVTPKMDPATAAAKIAPLLAAAANSTTKLIAPVPAFTGSDWLDKFFAACNCRDAFHAYSLHVYEPTADATKKIIADFRARFGDKPLWVTEIAPGNAGCALKEEVVEGFMSEMFSWGMAQGYIEKIFWNTGNQIDGGDTNVCNSFLFDVGGNPAPLMAHFSAVTC